MATEKKCLRCGGTNLKAGDLISEGGVSFRPEGTPFFTITSQNISVNAHICLDCGTLDLVGDAREVQALASKSE